MQDVQLRIGQVVELRGRTKAYWRRVCEENWIEHFVDPSTNEITMTLKEVDRYMEENTVAAEG